MKTETIKSVTKCHTCGSEIMVDHREYPDALPLQENKLLGIPTPKPIATIHKPFIVANVRDILQQWNNGNGDISFSRMVEMFNEISYQFHPKEKMYSREEVILHLYDILKSFHSIDDYTNVDEWIRNTLK